MSPKKVFISTSIPYVNAAPHIGHALEFVQADVLARYWRRRVGRENLFFLSGTDENAQKNVQSAEKEGISPSRLVDKYSKRFYQFKKTLNIAFNDFIRTTEERHIKGAQKLWHLCRADIYKKKYKGLYCVGCEAFKTEKELVDGKCPEHKKKPELIEEENYFFRLSKYEKQLKELIESGTIAILPKERKNEVLAFIDQGLEDFSISRDAERVKHWGIPVPDDPSQMIYVWFDALINYITGLNFGTDQKLYNRFWNADSQKIHVIGKGIIRFHAVYWPAMLLSAGLPLPTHEFVHGYVTVNGEKISKSIGNVIDPFEVISKYGTDPVRYYLLKEIHPFKDGDFSYKRFEEIYNADLANGLGNLVQRITKLCEINNLSQRDFGFNFREIYDNFWNIEVATPFKNHLENFQFNRALEYLWEYIRDLDQQIDKKEPWNKPKNEVTEFLKGWLGYLLQFSAALEPFLPKTSEIIIGCFRQKDKILAPQEPLFPRV